MFYFHLRITVDEKRQKSIFRKFIKTFNASFYIGGSEVSKKGVEHVQAVVGYTDVPSNPKHYKTWTNKIGEFFKNEIGLVGMYYHRALKKSLDANILYCMKEVKMLYCSLTQEEFDKYMALTDEINADKERDIKEKLLARCKEYKDERNNSKMICFKDLTNVIRKLYHSWGKLAPNKTLMFQYLCFICEELNICEDELDNAYGY